MKTLASSTSDFRRGSEGGVTHVGVMFARVELFEVGHTVVTAHHRLAIAADGQRYLIRRLL